LIKLILSAVFISVLFFSCSSTSVVTIDQRSALKGHSPSEPSIAISQSDPQNIVAGSILDNFYLSKNGGKSWKKGKIKSKYGVYGDPVVISDKNGQFYFFHLSNPKGKAFNSEEFLDRIIFHRSTDQGKTFDTESFIGYNETKDQDKPWAVADHNTNAIYTSWTQFDKYGSKVETDRSNIMFSKSTDAGITWSDAIRINQKSGDCLDGDMTTEGAVPAAGDDGEIFVTWSFNDTIWLDISYDGGETWLKEDIYVSEQIGGWDIDVPGFGRVNGMPILVADHSSEKTNGNLYISFADQRNGTDNTDIWIVISEDKGITWSDPIKVNNDAGSKHQFFTWLAIDQSDGNLYSVFYDRRNHEDTKTDVYLAWSSDGGISFKNAKINDQAFTPNPKLFLGDYNNISVVKGVIAPIWTESHEFKTSIKTRVLKKQELSDL
jgi:Neuraminidase (sialidase)